MWINVLYKMQAFQKQNQINSSEVKDAICFYIKMLCAHAGDRDTLLMFDDELHLAFLSLHGKSPLGKE